MSRAYRISVKETVRRTVRAEDHVSTQLEMLDIFPAEQMAELLAAELIRDGFKREGDGVLRNDGETRVTVNLKTAIVSVQRQSHREVEVTGERAATSWDERGQHARSVRDQLKEDIAADLQKDVSKQEQSLQEHVTDQLEGQLLVLRQELDRAANRPTAAALKQKAAQLGQIKELTEDPQSGSLTIVVEV